MYKTKKLEGLKNDLFSSATLNNLSGGGIPIVQSAKANATSKAAGYKSPYMSFFGQDWLIRPNQYKV